MARKYLGEAFDIHAGGVDLRFPHHENEQAQSRAAGFPFTTYWMHNAWITTAGEKMSKSLGNSLVVPAVLQRVRAIELRYYMVSAHYRSHVEFSFEALDEAAQGFQRIEHFLSRAQEVIGGEVPLGVSCADFETALDDVLSTPAAFAAIFEVVREGNKALTSGDETALRGAAGSVRGMLAVLGLDPFDPAWDRGSGGGDEELLRSAVDTLLGHLLAQRQEARAAKDFATADAIRDQVQAAGIEIEDGPQGSSWSLR
jgi:cysteinyl-tRNA synthetase